MTRAQEIARSIRIAARVAEIRRQALSTLPLRSARGRQGQTTSLSPSFCRRSIDVCANCCCTWSLADD
jgi:hypothetical protein